jgi:hypothetical protein
MGHGAWTRGHGEIQLAAGSRQQAVDRGQRTDYSG